VQHAVFIPRVFPRFLFILYELLVQPSLRRNGLFLYWVCPLKVNNVLTYNLTSVMKASELWTYRTVELSGDSVCRALIF